MITSRRPVGASLAATALAVALASCSSDDGGEPGIIGAPAPSSSATPAPTSGLSPTPSYGGAYTPLATATAPATSPADSAAPAPTAAGSTSAGVPPAFTREPVSREPVGGPLGVAAVRAAEQDGYDRVVFQLGGKAKGQPGWRVQYVERPTSDGSGDPVAVAGSSYLQVVMSGMGYPMDTGVTEPKARRLTPTGTELVREVVLDGVFEGQFAAFVGVDRTVPYRMFRLADPARLVVDVQHR